MTLEIIKAEKQNTLDKLLKDCRVFFAFSNKQFLESKTELQENEKYIKFFNGSFVPSFSYDAFASGLKKMEEDFETKINTSPELRRQNILYNLSNHECFYTGEIEDALDALGENYTEEEVLKVFYSERNNQNY